MTTITMLEKTESFGVVFPDGSMTTSSELGKEVTESLKVLSRLNLSSAGFVGAVKTLNTYEGGINAILEVLTGATIQNFDGYTLLETKIESIAQAIKIATPIETVKFTRPKSADEKPATGTKVFTLKKTPVPEKPIDNPPDGK